MHPRFQTAFAQLADNLQSALNLFWQTSTSRFVDRGASLIAEERNGAGRRRAGIRTTSAGGSLCAYAIVEF